MYIKLMLALCCLLFIIDCLNAFCMYVWMQLRVKQPATVFLSPSLPARTANQKLEAAIHCWLNYHGQCFPHWEGTFSLPCPFVLPDSSIYCSQKLSEGLWRDINEKKCTESPAGTWTQEKKRLWVLSGGGSPLFNSYIWALFYAACRILTPMIKSNVTLTPLFYLWTHRRATSTGHYASYAGSYTGPSLSDLLKKERSQSKWSQRCLCCVWWHVFCSAPQLFTLMWISHDLILDR